MAPCSGTTCAAARCAFALFMSVTPCLMRLFFLLLTFFSTSLASAQSLPAQLDTIVSTYARLGKFNGTALVAAGGRVVLHRGYGYRDVAQKLPNDTSTIFQIGSLTKAFTGAVILTLQEQGKLNVRDPLVQYLPDFPNADRITVHYLLTHTAGIYNYTDSAAFMMKQATKPITREAMLASFAGRPLRFAPGTRHDYSNSGYLLLGYLAADVSGQPYETLVRQWIFTPLGMRNAGFDFAHLRHPNRAQGYFALRPGPAPAPVVDSSFSYAAGSIYATAADLYRWHRGWQDGKILTEQSRRQATTPFLDGYAYGWGVDTVAGKQVLRHSGGIFGFTSFLERVPADDLCVILLSNGSNSLSELSRTLREAALGRAYTLPKSHVEIKLPNEILDEYVGEYEFTPNFKLMVWREGTQLITQATRQGPIPIFPEREDYFFVKLIDAQLEFHRDRTEKITGLTLHQDGQKIPAKRVQ
jgi:CubicO group peptidase (beta-lactamase class C family)